MKKPVIGIIGNSHFIEGDYPMFGCGQMDMRAIGVVANCLPLIIPANPTYTSIDALISTCDGFLFTGGRPNVHPEEYGEEVTEKHGRFDRHRDSLTLPLIERSVEIGLPIFGICRGFQEINVAMGGSLYPEIRELPGRMNHRMPPDGTFDEKFALRHNVTFSENGFYHNLIGEQTVMTNTLHGQGIKRAGDNIVIDGYADDGTPEAIYIKDSPGFNVAVQWHPEYRACKDPVSRKLFTAFGEAARSYSVNR